MGCTSCFSAPSYYSFQAGAGIPAPKCLCSTQAQMQVGTLCKLDSADLGSSACSLILEAPRHSLRRPNHPHQGLLARFCMVSALHSMSLELLSQGKEFPLHSRCEPRGHLNFCTWTHHTHFVLTSGDEHLMRVEMIQAAPPDPKFSIKLVQSCRGVDITSRLSDFLMIVFLNK